MKGKSKITKSKEADLTLRSSYYLEHLRLIEAMIEELLQTYREIFKLIQVDLSNANDGEVESKEI